MKVTEQAAEELKKVLENYGQEGAGIRIFSTQGCCGPAIKMDVAKQPENKQIVNIEGIDFYIDKDLMDSLTTVTIEYGEQGFRLAGLQAQGGGCCG